MQESENLISNFPGVVQRVACVIECVCVCARARTPHHRALLLQQLFRERARFAGWVYPVKWCFYKPSSSSPILNPAIINIPPPFTPIHSLPTDFSGRGGGVLSPATSPPSSCTPMYFLACPSSTSFPLAVLSSRSPPLFYPPRDLFLFLLV